MKPEYFFDKKVLPFSNRNSLSKCNQITTRIIFVFILFTGLSQIGLGLGLLLSCRSNVEKISCAFSLKSHPCTGLVIPTYLGCLVICIALFGFGFLGRRATAILLAIAMTAEIYFGLMSIYSETVSFTDYFRAFNSDEMCPRNSSSPALTECWNGITHLYPYCFLYRNLVRTDCTEAYDLYFTQFNESLSSTNIEPCVSDINVGVNSIYVGYRNFAGPLMLLNATICLLLVPILDFLYQQNIELNEAHVVLGPKEQRQAISSSV
ncbi:uncharacterized protein LOC115209622 [Argonauta hians]